MRFAIQIIQLAGNAPDITNTIVVGVEKTARVDLVDDGALDPRLKVVHVFVPVFYIIHQQGPLVP